MKNISRFLVVLLISIVGLSIPSGLSAAAAYFLGKNIWAWFFITGSVTAVIGWLWNMAQESRYKVLRESIEAQNKMADAFQNVETSCAYCNTRNVIRIALGKNNQFTCKNCNNNNNVQIQFSTSRVTTPVIADRVLNDVFTKLDNEPIPQNHSSVNTDGGIKIEGGKTYEPKK